MVVEAALLVMMGAMSGFAARAASLQNRAMKMRGSARVHPASGRYISGTVTFEISEMTCYYLVYYVYKTLMAVPGVKGVRMLPHRKRAVVTYDSGRVDAESLRRSLVKSHFTVKWTVGEDAGGVMRRGFVIFVVLTVVLAASSVSSRADEMDDLRGEMQALRRDYESKIEELQSRIEAMSSKQEREVAKIEEKVDKRLIDVEYVGRREGPFEKGGLIVRESSGFGAVSVGGYMDHEFEAFHDKTSTFDQHRWILNVGAELGDRLRFYSEYEIEHGGPHASGGGEAKVEQAWVDYLIEEWINLRGGVVLVPFGRYNLYHDSDLQDLTDRPLVNRDIIPTTWSESGAGIWGEFNPVIGDYEDLMVGYEAYVINGLDDGFSDTGMRGARGEIATDNNNEKSLAGRLVLSPALGHELGLSGYWGIYDADNNALTGGAVDWLSVWGPLEVVGEAAYFNVGDSAAMDPADYFAGGYVQANYHFWPEFLDDTFLGRSFEYPTFTLVGRYGWAMIDDDGDSGTGDNEEQRITLGLNYRPVETWVLKLEYQINETEKESLERGDTNGFMASVAMGF